MNIEWVLTDAPRAKAKSHHLGQSTVLGRSCANNHRLVNAALRIVQPGSPRVICPMSLFTLMRCSSALRTKSRPTCFSHLLKALSEQPNLEYPMTGATITEVHRLGHDAITNLEQAIGHSWGGCTTKTLALTDVPGNPVKFILMPEQRHIIRGVKELVTEARFDALVAGKVLDANWLIEEFYRRGQRW